MAGNTDSERRAVLDAETIAVVGCSATPGKPAHEVPAYLDAHGYTVVPVNPYAERVLGHAAADSLAEIDQRVDVVDVFRPREEVPGIVDVAIARDDVGAVWLQVGIQHADAEERAAAAGLRVVSNSCIKVDHQRLVAP